MAHRAQRPRRPGPGSAARPRNARHLRRPPRGSRRRSASFETTCGRTVGHGQPRGGRHRLAGLAARLTRSGREAVDRRQQLRDAGVISPPRPRPDRRKVDDHAGARPLPRGASASRTATLRSLRGVRVTPTGEGLGQPGELQGTPRRSASAPPTRAPRRGSHGRPSGRLPPSRSSWAASGLQRTRRTPPRPRPPRARNWPASSSPSRTPTRGEPSWSRTRAADRHRRDHRTSAAERRGDRRRAPAARHGIG